MAHSIFYDDYFRVGPPVTGLLFEKIMDTLKGEVEQGFERLPSVVADSLVECGLVDGTATEEAVVHVLQGLDRIAKANTTADKEVSETDPAGKFFAGYLAGWAGKLDVAGLCLYVADYDFFKARDYYTQLDQQTLVAIAHDKLQFEFERARVSFEAAMFGFGGSYKGSSDANTEEFDLTSDNASAEVLLKNLGF
jgi:hypothetical protein